MPSFLFNLSKIRILRFVLHDLAHGKWKGSKKWQWAPASVRLVLFYRMGLREERSLDATSVSKDNGGAIYRSGCETERLRDAWGQGPRHLGHHPSSNGKHKEAAVNGRAITRGCEVTVSNWSLKAQCPHWMRSSPIRLIRLGSLFHAKKKKKKSCEEEERTMLTRTDDNFSPNCSVIQMFRKKETHAWKE